MPVPNTMADLATLAGSNSPAGSEAIGNSLDNYLRAISAILRSTNALASATIAAASTTDIGSADGESVQITGSATITSLGTGFNGCRRELRFSGACTLTHSANLSLPGGANITTAAGDAISFRCVGSGQWLCTARARAVPSSADVIAGLGYTPVNKAGDTMTGGLSLDTSLVSTTAFLVLGATGAGTIFLRPNGVGSTAGQSVINSSGDLSVTGDISMAGTYLYGDGKAIARYDDAFLRLNPSGNFSSGIYGGTGVLRHDGDLDLSNSGFLTLQGGNTLTKLTVSSSAPGTLQSGELYLRY